MRPAALQIAVSSFLLLFGVIPSHATPADTATGTLVQGPLGSINVTDNGPPGFLVALPFDPSLGTLEDVTLQLFGYANTTETNDFFLSSPPSTGVATATITVSYGAVQFLNLGPTDVSVPAGPYIGSITADYLIDETVDLSNALSTFIDSSLIAIDPSPQQLVSFNISGGIMFSVNYENFSESTSLQIEPTLTYTYSYTIPEPASALVLTTGLLGVAWCRRRSA